MSESAVRQAPSAAGARFGSVAAWSVVAAFGTYFCMYAFRKPFTAATFSGATVFGLGEKAVFVTAQVLGYTASKVVGIRAIAETPPERRAVGIVALIAVAEAALLLFAVVPPPLQVVCLFVNGLPLGLVFGLVLGFLEGRRTTEAVTAGLCASFILADGLTKSVGTWLLGQGVPERWMPATAGLLFVPPLLLFVGMLTRIPPPGPGDVAARSDRAPMTRQDRGALLSRHGFGLALIVATYFLVTIVRSLRADFAPEIWRGLGVTVVPSTFARSELVVAVVVLAANGLTVLIGDNRRAFLASLGIAASGALLMLAALAGWERAWLGPFGFMVLIGSGLYLPYVAVHTTVFERLIAMTRDRGNLGFLMYVADAAGYLGYAGLMLARGAVPSGEGFLRFFLTTCGVAGVASAVCLTAAGLHFARRAAPTGGVS